MKNLTVLNLALCLFYVNCAHPVKKVEEDSGIREFDIMANIPDSRKINLSTVALNIEYCMLETDEKCFVTPSMAIYCSNDYIVTIGQDRPSHAVCYVFDRKTGKFVRQISRMGQGPGEYTELNQLFWDEISEQVLVFGNNYYIFYNLDGTISHKINRNEHPFSTPSIVYDDYYVRYVPNQKGNESKRIVFYDRTGVLIDSIPNFRTWKKTPSIHGGGFISDGKFHVFRNELYYIDMYSDTLYHIKDFTLQPRYIFNTGGQAIPYEMHETSIDDFRLILSGDRYEKYVVIEKILEDAKRLYFTFDYRKLRYPAIYDKTTDKLQIMPPVSIPPRSRDWRIPLHGFENDLDGGLLFWPKQMISEKEMMCVYTAEELLELDASKITDAKLKNVLNSLEEDSNPVVAIVSLKD